MKKQTVPNVIEQYITSCMIIQSATEIGDFKKSNKEQSKLISAYKWIEANMAEAHGIFSKLLQYDNPVVQTKAATHCLSLNINKEWAINVLLDVAKRKDIWGFNAEKVIEVYKERGYLKAY